MIRRAHGAELDVVERLQKLILPYDKPDCTSSGAWWLARDENGAPVAFAGIKQSVHWSDAMYLCRSGVLGRARGKGMQRRLIAVRERHARRLGKNWLISDTTDNPASANSLIGAGFRMYEPSSPWGLKAACYWRKKLA